MIALILSEKDQGIPSSGIQFSFWGALIIYAGIKLRTLILLSKDQVCSYLCVYKICKCLIVKIGKILAGENIGEFGEFVNFSEPVISFNFSQKSFPA